MGKEETNIAIFISYSHTNRKIATEVSLELRNKGFEVWFEFEDVKVGDNFTSQILEAIQSSTIILYFISKESATSLHSKKELKLALIGENGRNPKLVIPVLIDDTEIPFSLNRRVPIDLTTEQLFESEIAKLITIIQGFEIGTKINEPIADIQTRFVPKEESFLKLQKQKLSYNPSRYIERKIVVGEDTTNLGLFLGTPGITLREAIQQHKRLVVLGEPGAGKSWELQNLTYLLSEPYQALLPVYLPLRQYQGEKFWDEFLDKDAQRVEESRLLLILDGLDEVLAENRAVLENYLADLVHEKPTIKIVISCRTSIYGDSLSEQGFERGKILLLNQEEIGAYTRKILGSQESFFLEKLKKNKLQELSKNPFFLIELINSFNYSSEFPRNKKDILQDFVDNLIQRDLRKYKALNNFERTPKELLESFRRVALGMEMIGKNCISRKEFEQLIPDFELRDFQLRSSLVNLGSGDEQYFQFQHNNYQEFLAAVVLAEMEHPEDVISLITFPRSQNRIRPLWHNTIRFLFDILDERQQLYGSLFDVVLASAPALLFSLEVPINSTEKATRIIKGFLEKLADKSINISSKLPNYNGISAISGNAKSLEYLWERISDNINNAEKYNALKVLVNISSVPSTSKTKAIAFLVDRLKDWESEEKYFTFLVIKGLINIQLSKTKAKSIAKELNSMFLKETDRYIKASCYQFYLNYKLVDDYIGFYLNGIERIVVSYSTDGSEDTHLMDEGLFLKLGLKSIQSQKALLAVLKYFSQYIHHFVYELSELEEHLFKLAESLYSVSKNQAIPKACLDLVQNLTLINRLHQESPTIKFFNTADLNQWIIKQLIDKLDTSGNVELVSLLFNMDCISVIIEGGPTIERRDMEYLYLQLVQTDPNTAEALRVNVNEVRDFKIEKKEIIDWELVKKKEQDHKMRLLFNKEEYIKEVQTVLSQLHKKSYSFKDFREFAFRQNDFSGWLLQDLINITRASPLGRKEIINSLRERDWELFMASTLYSYLKKDPKAELNQSQKNWILDWCKSNIVEYPIIDFFERQTIPTKLVMLWEFRHWFDIDYPKGKLLDLLSFDYSTSIPDNGIWSNQYGFLGVRYIEKAFEDQIEVVTERILENLHGRIYYWPALNNHIDYCKRHKVKEANESLLEIILGDVKLDGSLDNPKLEALKAYCEINPSDLSELENRLPNYPENFLWYVVDELKFRSREVVEAFLFDLIKSGSSILDQRYQAAKRLVELGEPIGLIIIKEWIERNKSVDFFLFMNGPIPNITGPEFMDSLFALLPLAFSGELTEENREHLKTGVINALKNISQASEESFLKVISSLEGFISDGEDENPLVGRLNHSLDWIKDQYYLNKSGVREFTKVLKNLAKTIQLRFKRDGPKVFLSYTTKDRVLAKIIYNVFREQGMTVFMDVLSLKKQERPGPRIRQEINESDFILLIWNEDSQKSTWVNQEIGVGIGIQKPILIIPTDKTPYNGPMDLVFGSLLYEDVDPLKVLNQFAEQLSNFEDWKAFPSTQKDTGELDWVDIYKTGSITDFCFGLDHFVMGKQNRTFQLNKFLEREIKTAKAYHKYCLRIQAAYSCFSIPEKDDDLIDRHLGEMRIDLRNELTQTKALIQGVRLKAFLNPVRAYDPIFNNLRLRTLIEFLEEELRDRERYAYHQFVIGNYRGGNKYIFDSNAIVVGHKGFSDMPGYELNEFSTRPEVLNREVEIFDTSFDKVFKEHGKFVENNSMKYFPEEDGFSHPVSPQVRAENKAVLEHVVKYLKDRLGGDSKI